MPRIAGVDREQTGLERHDLVAERRAQDLIGGLAVAALACRQRELVEQFVGVEENVLTMDQASVQVRSSSTMRM